MQTRPVYALMCTGHGFERRSSMKKAYRKPALRRLGLLRKITRFSF
ncbi:MAG TPA: hypothetical protein VGK43_02825 [Solirubrobacterales bacterium]